MADVIVMALKAAFAGVFLRVTGGTHRKFNGFEIGAEDGGIAVLPGEGGGIAFPRRVEIEAVAGLAATVVQETEMSGVREARELMFEGVGLEAAPIDPLLRLTFNAMTLDTQAGRFGIRQG